MDGRISRRALLTGLAALPAYAVLDGGILNTGVKAQGASAKAQSFEAHMVRSRARVLATRPYEPPLRTLPDGMGDLSYDQYRNIRFDRSRTAFTAEKAAFQAQWLARAFLFKDKIDLNIVSEGMAQAVAPDNSVFRFENGTPAPKPGQILGFSGFRLMNPLNRADIFDEVAVFQGASYFRAVGRGNVYGTSARGLALNTGDSRGEEFPLFREFWLEAPKADSQAMVLHALLDSVSAVAAFRFSIRPGDPTIITVEMALYPRKDLDQAGIGALTSMFLFGPNDHAGVDDFRPAVRDAEGLEYITDKGERVWRPLENPKRLEISVFADANIRGFGLMQRARSFFDYQDMEAAYERRPSVWVEPLGDWGEGSVQLVEIPAQEEIHDNIVAFWRPKAALRKGGEYFYNYRIHWGMNGPDSAPLARTAATRVGGTPERRLFVIDYTGEALKGIAVESITAQVTAGGGVISNIVVQSNPHLGGVRLSFNLEPKGAALIELRACLKHAEAALAETALTETWLYRWTAS